MAPSEERACQSERQDRFHLRGRRSDALFLVYKTSRPVYSNDTRHKVGSAHMCVCVFERRQKACGSSCLRARAGRDCSRPLKRSGVAFSSERASELVCVVCDSDLDFQQLTSVSWPTSPRFVTPRERRIMQRGRLVVVGVRLLACSCCSGHCGAAGDVSFMQQGRRRVEVERGRRIDWS